jgi:hypothetical protein
MADSQPGLWESFAAAVAAALTGGWALFKGHGVGNRIHRLQTSQQATATKVAVLEVGFRDLKERLDRIETKIDRGLERGR